jgi:tetratricopeptide (TPR) repeat protein
MQRAASTVRATALGVCTVVLIGCGRPAAPASASAPAVAPLKSEAEVRELDIAFFTERAERDPTGGTDLAHLGALYLARGRETGDPRDAELAEAAARRSLKNRPTHNRAAASVLQSSLLSQHRFVEALVLAKAARAEDPDNASLRASVGEIEMELGQYDSARVSFTALHAAENDLAVAPRLARWAEIQGRPERALQLLAAAQRRADREPSIPREQRAWYRLRVGDVLLRTGRTLPADSAYLAGLAIHPDDYRLLSALTHSAALQGKWAEAVRYGERAVARTLDPATLGALSDAYAALGDTAKSGEYARVLDVVVLNQPGAYHRAWSLFLLDHDRHVATVSRKIREELRTRHDVYAYDLLAWSLHKQGRHREAREAMTLALREGTVDVQLRAHAAAIDRALGNGATRAAQP